MPTLRETINAIKKRKKAIEDTMDTAGSQMTPPAAATPKEDPTDLLSPAALEREYQKQKAAKPKKGWLW